MRDQDGRAVACGGEDPIEDLCSPRTSSCAVGSSNSTTPAPISIAHNARARGDALPLAAGEIGSALVAASQPRVETGQLACARGCEGPIHRLVGCAGKRDVVAQRQLEAGEILKDGGDASRTRQ